MLWAASIDGHLSSLVACHCTYLYLFNLFVYLANKLSLSLFSSNFVLCTTIGIGVITLCLRKNVVSNFLR